MNDEVFLDNLTGQSCAEVSLVNASENYDNLTAYKVLDIVLVLYNFILMIAGVFLSSLVIYLVVRYKKLQTCSFVVVLQIVSLDVPIAIIVPGCIIANAIARSWILHWHMCVFIGFFLLFISLARSFLMDVLALHHFLHIFYPFKFPRIEAVFTGILSAFSWILAFIVSLIPLPGVLDCYHYVAPTYLCFFGPVCSKTCNTYVILFWSVIGLPASLLPVILYSALYWKARKMKQALSRTMNNATRVHTINNKAVLTCFLLFLSVFLLQVPSNMVVAAVDTITDKPGILGIFKILSSSINTLIVVADPIVVLRNRDAKHAISKLKCTSKCTIIVKRMTAIKDHPTLSSRETLSTGQL